MPTIESLIREAVESQDSEQRGINERVLSVLNRIGNRGLVSLPGEGDLGMTDLKRDVPEENVKAVRSLVLEAMNQ